MRFPSNSANQSAPSEPRAIELDPHSAVGSAKVRTLPAAVIRPMALPSKAANQMAPSGPTVNASGPRAALSSGNASTADA
jgi:hypothetical protein